MTSFRSRQGFRGSSPPTSQLANALAFISRSTSAYTLVVASDTCPSQARIVLMSTPERSRWVAVVWRIVCGLTRLVARDGTSFTARAAQRSTSVWMPNRVMGRPQPIQEHVFARITALHQRSQFADRLRPQRAPAGLVPFAPDQDRGQVAVGYLRQRQVADPNLGRFIGPGTGVVQEQEQRMIPTALGGRHVWCRQQAHPSPAFPST